LEVANSFMQMVIGECVFRLTRPETNGEFARPVKADPSPPIATLEVTRVFRNHVKNEKYPYAIPLLYIG